jgi:hypothetical protein
MTAIPFAPDGLDGGKPGAHPRPLLPKFVERFMQMTTASHAGIDAKGNLPRSRAVGLL